MHTAEVSTKAWLLMTDDERRNVWAEFYRRFEFNPSYVGIGPGIVEQKQSTAYDISHVYGGKKRYQKLTTELCYAYAEAFRAFTPVESSILVLDWQHNCYNLFPHREFVFYSEDDWPIPALPNGDYYIFLSQDMSCGAFGHPWRQTICVWGEPLQKALAVNTPALLTRPIRASGRPI